MPNTNVILEQVYARLDRIEQLLLGQRNAMFDKETLDLDEAVAYTSYSKGYLYKMTSQRQIPHFKKSRKIYFDKKRLDEWMKEQPIKTKDEIESEAQTYCATHKPKCQ